MSTHKLSTDDLLALSSRLIKFIENDYSDRWTLPKHFVELFDEENQAAAKFFYDKVAESYRNIEQLTTLSVAQHDWHRETFTFTDNIIAYNTAVYIYKEAQSRKPSQLLQDWSSGSCGKKGKVLAVMIKIFVIAYIFIFAPWFYLFAAPDSLIQAGIFVVLWLIPIASVVSLNSIVKIPREIDL